MAKAEGKAGVDPKVLEAFKKKAKAKGGKVIQQLPINSWAKQEFGFVLSGDFVAIREGKKKIGSAKEPGHLFDIINSETGNLETWGCPGILHSRLMQNLVTEGDSLEIMLVGKVPNQYGNDSWDFVVVHYPK